MYADDVKIFKTFNDVNGFNLLRADFFKFYKWWRLNLLELTHLELNFFFLEKVNFFLFYIENTDQ